VSITPSRVAPPVGRHQLHTQGSSTYYLTLTRAIGVQARAARAKTREHEEREKKRTAQGDKSHGAREVSHGAASSTNKRGAALNQLIEKRRSEIEEMLAVKLMVMGDDVHDGTGVPVDDFEVVGFHGRVEGQALPPGVKPWRPPRRVSEPLQQPRSKAARIGGNEVRTYTSTRHPKTLPVG